MKLRTLLRPIRVRLTLWYVLLLAIVLVAFGGAVYLALGFSRTSDVDNILSDTTGHRRFLFEEAAGIMKYKTRKKEALTKLDATERDLLRVNDIITDIGRLCGADA